MKVTDIKIKKFDNLDITFTIYVTKQFHFRLWLCSILLQAASWVLSGHTCNVDYRFDKDVDDEHGN